MKLYVIGNGFDLAHKIPSAYIDFKNYLEDVNVDFLNRFERQYYDLHTLWKDFESNLPRIFEDNIYDDGMAMGNQLREEHDYDSFTDDGLSYYLEDEYGFINHLQILILAWVNSLNCIVEKVFPDDLFSDEDYYLVFNYTLTLERTYDVDPNKILHIHGSTNTKHDGKPIIGHARIDLIEDARAKFYDARNHFDSYSASSYQAIEKYYLATLKETNLLLDLNKDFFSSRIIGVDEIFILGCSISDTDKIYFSEILKVVGPEIVWNVSYYNDIEMESHKMFLIELGVDTYRINLFRFEELTKSKRQCL